MNKDIEHEINISEDSYVLVLERKHYLKEFCIDLKNLLLPIVLVFGILSILIYIACLI